MKSLHNIYCSVDIALNMYICIASAEQSRIHKLALNRLQAN